MLNYTRINIADYIATIEGDPIFTDVPIERIKQDFLQKYGLTSTQYDKISHKTVEIDNIEPTLDGPRVLPSRKLPRTELTDTHEDRANKVLTLKKIGLTNTKIVSCLGMNNKIVQSILKEKHYNGPVGRGSNKILLARQEEYLASAVYGE